MSVKSYRLNDKEMWKVYVNLRCPNNPSIRKQRTAVGIDSKSAALRLEKQIIAELSSELSIESKRGIKWNKLLEKWEKDARAGYIRKYEPNTIDDLLLNLRKWTAAWMDLSSDELTRAEGRDLHKLLESSLLTKKAKEKIRSAVNTIFKYGVEERYIKGNIPSPVEGLSFTGSGEKVPDILSLKEIKQFLNCAKQIGTPWYPIWAFALLTGMRNGELYALTWDDIDLDNSMIRVSKSYNSRSKITKTTKAECWRNVPISGELKQVILNLKANLKSRKFEEQKFVLPRLGYWSKGEQAKELRKFLKSIGLPSVKFHALRACFATQLLVRNIPAIVVMKIGGWKNLKTMEIYIRLAGIDEAGATDTLKFLPSEEEVFNNVVSLFSN